MPFNSFHKDTPHDSSLLPLYSVQPHQRERSLRLKVLGITLLGLVAACVWFPKALEAASVTTMAIVQGQPAVTVQHTTGVLASVRHATPHSTIGNPAAPSSSWRLGSVAQAGSRSTAPVQLATPSPYPWRAALGSVLGLGLLATLLHRAYVQKPLREAQWSALSVGASEADGEGRLAGKTVVFVGRFQGSGHKKEELIKLAKAEGAIVRTQLSGKTDFVVTGTDSPDMKVFGPKQFLAEAGAGPEQGPRLQVRVCVCMLAAAARYHSTTTSHTTWLCPTPCHQRHPRRMVGRGECDKSCGFCGVLCSSMCMGACHICFAQEPLRSCTQI